MRIKARAVARLVAVERMVFSPSIDVVIAGEPVIFR
jgi:hypothetical protein